MIAFVEADRNLDKTISIPSVLTLENEIKFKGHQPMIDEDEDEKIFYESLPLLPEANESENRFSFVPQMYRTPFSDQCPNDEQINCNTRFKKISSRKSFESLAHLPPTLGSVSNFQEHAFAKNIAAKITTQPSAESRAYLPSSRYSQIPCHQSHHS